MNTDSYTPLHHAALNGHTSTVKLLLTNGALINAPDNDNNTPLHLAVWKSHIDVVEILLHRGASIQAKNKYLNSPLHLAAWNGHTGIAGLLLEEYALMFDALVPQEDALVNDKTINIAILRCILRQ